MKTAAEILFDANGMDGNIRPSIIKAMEEYADQFKPKWTPIEEEMPPTGFFIFWFVNEPQPVIWYNTGIKSQKWIENNKGSFWMPLPEPPKQ